MPCLTCGAEHTYVISEDAFFAKKVLSLSCTYTGIDICFIGKKEDTLRALKETTGS